MNPLIEALDLTQLEQQVLVAVAHSYLADNSPVLKRTINEKLYSIDQTQIGVELLRLEKNGWLATSAVKLGYDVFEPGYILNEKSKTWISENEYLLKAS